MMSFLLRYKKGFSLFLHRFLCATVLFFGTFGQAFSEQAPIRLVTSDLTPYSIEKGIQPGIFVELVQEAMRRLGRTVKVEFYPWTRAQKIAEQQDNVILFPLARTAPREDQYQWLMPVAPMELVFVSAQDRPVDLMKARKLGRIAVQKSTPAEAYLVEQGFTNLRAFPKAASTNIKLLVRARVDAWFTAKGFAQYLIKQTGETNLQIGPVIDQSFFYVAASRNFPEDLSWELRRVLNKLAQDGTLSNILSRYR
ncbi:ABC transporter substrate-binding protein [Terasakiella brassicae]|uniref:ABC transporter substrate-binding protein n=1 Tax=Terasakiella brassicae TaxID=1634917 RepID=A0A917BNU1_9PROT|nr:ABC transporter substrate-binding protein [Terasakiella brassicae]